MVNRLSFVRLLLGLTILLSGCQLQAGRQAEPVSPVDGMPQGTDAFPWWNDTVFYEIFVRSFSDSNGDGIGDFNGITARLDYLNDGDPKTTTDLGVTGIWLMPIFQSPSYHGYDVIDYYKLNWQYGSMDDFKLLLDEAHKRGIRVILDLVLNHTSSLHPWFVEARQGPLSERRSWYVWSETDPGFRGPGGETVWHPTDNGYYYGLFSGEMPDLNYTNPQVVTEMDHVARFWLEEVGVDGFRLDAARHIIEEGASQENTAGTHHYWQNFRTYYKGIKPQALTVGEVWTANPSVATYVQGDELDLAFNFDLASAVLLSVGVGNTNKVSAELLASQKYFLPGQYASFLSNHDQTRVMSRMGGSLEKAKVAAAILLTTPGVPFVYYGEEIGMAGTKPDELIRTPMQWSSEANAGFSAKAPWERPNPDFSQGISVQAQSKDPESLLSLYRSLIQLRNQHAALRVGEYLPVDSANPSVLAYLRSSKEENLLVVINLGKQAVSEYSLELAQGPLSGSPELRLAFQEGNFPVKLAQLTANAAGGFEAYRPVETLPAYGILMVQLK